MLPFKFSKHEVRAMQSSRSVPPRRPHFCISDYGRNWSQRKTLVQLVVKQHQFHDLIIRREHYTLMPGTLH